MSEQEVHEIQLNGKQLVFMFMAATVVSVVIFLCGVMVGRGVRQPQADALATNASTPVDPTASIDDSSSATTLPLDPVPAPERENLTYGKRLQASVPIDEPIKPAPVEKPAVTAAVAEKKPAPLPEQATSRASFAEPPGKGLVIQVMAYPTRAEAEALARRLDAKGYPAFVTENDDAPRARYRVRVGKYTSKRDRDAIALRLQQEERFKPWLIP